MIRWLPKEKSFKDKLSGMFTIRSSDVDEGDVIPQLVILDCGIVTALSETDLIQFRNVFTAIVQNDVSQVLRRGEGWMLYK